ncbi:NAD(P)H-binding protein [Natronocalculus amylovorans]|uniref:NAD(P)H-binding protein n=1 Tax=Natronocalculus amylovorans TaxID=2917812 RepID=A0AAE3K9C8_9EURY|nr:NAD(P)H-binding protein [Natronocalculus amylovorans]MCL9815924.1 NAD(P)H-binding protein [Natronocalculus amylovorans]NUE01560.1 NAD(P)H-binding protein [Halorubraceae archaeon YAN]
MRILVTGATGFVGSRLVPALVDAGHEVVALTRDAGTYKSRADVTVVEGDLLDAETLTDGFDVDVAYYLVHSLDSGSAFEEYDRIAARNFVAAAEAGGVRRVVYLGGLGDDSASLSKHLRSRREVEHILEERSFALTVLRAAIIIGEGSLSFTLIRQLADRLPVMITPQWVLTECQPIAIDDVITYLVGVLEHPETAGETYEIGGPDVFTYAEILRRVRAQLGKRLVIVPVPVLSPELSSRWIGLVTDVPPAAARPLVSGLKNPVTVTDHRIETIIPIERTPFETAVAQALVNRSAKSSVEPVIPVVQG